MGLLDGTTDNTTDTTTSDTTSQASTWNPTDGTSQYTTVAGVPALATATNATAANANAQTRDVADNELVTNQLSSIMGDNSPLLQRAKASALETANSRGLLNSSMAVGAATGAVLDRATPLAQSNAATISNVNNQNLSNQQQTELTNTANQQATNQLNAQQQTNTSLANASEQNKVLSQMMDQQNKLQLADIEAQYKTLMQSQASAMTLYQQSVKNISEILMNPDLTEDAKKAAVSNQNSLLKSGMQIVGAMGGLNLDDLLTFNDTGTGGNSSLTLGNDLVSNGKQLALYSGISAAADVTALGKLPIESQSAINQAIASKDKNAMIAAIANTTLSQDAKNKLLSKVS